MRRRLGPFLAAAALAGCASSSMNTGDDARRDDAALTADAGVDAPVDAPAARAGREVVSGGGRIRAGAITMDVQLGHPVEQSKATAGSITLRGAAVVNP